MRGHCCSGSPGQAPQHVRDLSCNRGPTLLPHAFFGLGAKPLPGGFCFFLPLLSGYQDAGLEIVPVRSVNSSGNCALNNTPDRIRLQKSISGSNARLGRVWRSSSPPHLFSSPLHYLRGRSSENGIFRPLAGQSARCPYPVFSLESDVWRPGIPEMSGQPWISQEPSEKST